MSRKCNMEFEDDRGRGVFEVTRWMRRRRLGLAVQVAPDDRRSLVYWKG